MKFSDLNISKAGQEVLLVGGIWAGAGDVYLCYFPQYGIPEGLLHSFDMTKEDWQVLLRQSDLMEIEVLAQAEDGKMHKAVIRKCQRNIQQGVSWAVYRRDGYRCRYCDKEYVPLTVDHLVLWEEGGPSIEENLVASCRKCNKTRGNTPYAAWLKHPYYLKVSKRLPAYVRESNEALVDTLDSIPRLAHKQTR